MRILILGGTSLTGPFVVRRLDGMGHQVTVCHRGKHEADLPAGVRHIHADWMEAPREQASELREAGRDVVVQMWAATEAHAVRFLEMFGDRAERAVVISSGDVYRAYGRLRRLEAGPPGATPIGEDGPLRESRYPYRGSSMLPAGEADQYDKVLVETALRAQSRWPVTLLRFPAVYGPNDQHRLGVWLRRMEQGGELKIEEGQARWRWTHGFSEDVAEAVVRAVTNERAAGGTYNVGEAQTPMWAERLEEWGRVAGWKGRIVPVGGAEIPEDERMPYDWAHHVEIDTGRIRSELGYREVVAREEGIARTIAWERGEKSAG
jgi:nucleoside-diphosphate-sugar epimerase